MKEGEEFNVTKIITEGELFMQTPTEIAAYLTYHIKAGLFIGTRSAGQNYIDDFITQNCTVVPIEIALKSTNIDLSREYEWGAEGGGEAREGEGTSMIKRFFPYIAIIAAP